MAQISKKNHAKKYSKLNLLLQELMNKERLSSSKLSQLTGIPLQTIIRLRTDPKVNPTMASLTPIARYFNITVSQLIGDEETINIYIPLVRWDKLNNWLDGKANKYILRYIPLSIAVTENAFAIQMTSHDFGTTFIKDSILIIEPMKPQNGDYIIACLANTDKVELLQVMTDDDNFYLRHANPKKAHIQVMSNTENIIGVVLEMHYCFHTGKNIKQDADRLQCQAEPIPEIS